MREKIQSIIANLPIRYQVWVLANVERFNLVRSAIYHWLSHWRYQSSAPVREYINFNKKQFRNKFTQEDSLILTDCFQAPQWIFTNSIFLNELSKNFGASIASFGFFPREPNINAIYSSFGAKQHLRLNLTTAQRRRQKELYRSIIRKSTTAEELFELHIEGIGIGIDIYESILRSGFPTVDMSSYHTKYTIYHGLRHFVFFYDLIQSGRVKAIAPSHDCYLQIGILVKISHKFEIPVYFANPFELVRSTKSHDLYAKFSDYSKYFAVLDQKEKNAAILSAKHALTQRLNGMVGVGMSYQIESAFASGNISRQTSTDSKLKVLVATHCFFDNPHAYSKMLYRDYYQWLEFLGEISARTDYEWYIKPHRDFLPGTMETLQKFVADYPKFKLIDPQTTFHQLKDEGVSIALTCYGSIGHELPFLGYRVINASYNPHIGYRFNTHCCTRDEYERLLMKLDDLPPVEDLDSIYEFYAVHHHLTKSDKLLFRSFSEFEKFIRGDVLGDRCYEFFMQNPSQNVERYHRHVDAFLASDCHYEFELRLPNWTVKPYRFDTAQLQKPDHHTNGNNFH